MEWWVLIGPVVAIVVSFWLTPTQLVLLGGAAAVGFFISFGTSSQLYGECDPCSTSAETLFWVNGILFTLAPSLIGAGLIKLVVAGLSHKRART